MSVDSPALPLAPAADSYWSLSTRPLASLAVVAPLLLGYEAGVLALGSGAIRNGADVWLRALLDLAGLGQYFLLPVLVCGILLAWHHARGDAWGMDSRVLGTMWLEAAVLGLALLILAQCQAGLLSSWAPPAPAAVADGGAAAFFARLVGYCGAGIYEELLFRLLLLPPAVAALRWIGMNRTYSLGCAIGLTSLAFAAAHYRIDVSLFGWHLVTAHGESFSWFSFLFRTLAGSVFALVFALRGFGIAAGAHAIYDLLVLVL